MDVFSVGIPLAKSMKNIIYLKSNAMDCSVRGIQMAN